MHATGAGVLKIAVSHPVPRGLHPIAGGRRDCGRDLRMVLIAMGPHGLATPGAAAALLLDVVVRRVGRSRRSVDAGDAARLISVPIAQRHDRRVRPRRIANRPFRLAADAQRRLSGQPGRRGVSAAPGDGRPDDFVTFAQAIGLRGASVTIPFKVSLFEHVDEVEAVARRVGAINTIRVDGDGRWLGGNTDVVGFSAAAHDRGIPLHGAARSRSSVRAARRVRLRLRSRRPARR